MSDKKRRQERQRGVRRENRHEAEKKQHQRGGEWDCISIPEGLSVFKPEKDKTYHIDVIPYIAGQHNKGCNQGDEFYVLTYPVYRKLGLDEKDYIAIGQLLGVKDPVAEHFAALRKAGAVWDDMKMFKPTERQLWLFFVHEEADKGLQLYEAGYQTFGKQLLEEIEESGETEWIDNFDDPSGGATLKVRFRGENVMGNVWVKATKINFIERENGFDADGDPKLAAKVLDKAAETCLDELLKIADYKTLKAALDGEPATDDDDDDDEDAAPKAAGLVTRKAKPPVDEDEDEDDDPPAPKAKGKGKAKPPTAEDLGIEKGGIVEHDDYGTCTVTKITGDGLTVSIRDEDGNVYRDIDPSDLEPAAPKAKGKGKAKPPVDEDEDDDEDIPFGDEDEDDDPPAQKAKAKAKAAVPAKGKTKPPVDEDEDEDDDPPAPKAKGKAKPPVDDEDDDEPQGKGKAKGNSKGNWDDW